MRMLVELSCFDGKFENWKMLVRYITHREREPHRLSEYAFPNVSTVLLKIVSIILAQMREYFNGIASK